MAPLQDPVERPAIDDQLGAVRRVNELLEQLVDDRILDADFIAAAGHVRRLRPPEIALLVARRERLREQRGDHVEIKILAALLVLRRIDRPYRALDAKALQRFDVWLHDTFGSIAGLQQEFEFERLAILHARAAVELPACFIQEQCRLGEVLGIGAAAVGDRRIVFGGEDLVRNLAAQGLEDLQLLR